MNNIVKLDNGMVVGIRIAEITTIPYYELISKDLEKANQDNQMFFSKLLNNFYRKSTDGKASLELMFSSTAVDNQTYKAQVLMHFCIRYMGTSLEEVETKLNSFEDSFKNDFTENFYDIHFYKSEDDFLKYEKHLNTINVSNIMSVGKREDEILSTISQNGYIYYTYVPKPAENINTSSISNVLTQYPESAIILEIIPTNFNQTEIDTFQYTSRLLQYYASNMMRQMMRPDKMFQKIADCYQTYLEECSEDIYYYNFIICSGDTCANDISSKLIDSLEDINKEGGAAYEGQKLSLRNIDLVGILPVMPWILSNQLIYKERNPIFWQGSNRPDNLIRLRNIITSHELRAVFKLPIDDGKTIGINSKKVLINRERLNENIISEGNFKVGIIQNASKNGIGEGAHAGIPLNQFTKHGLIVGMPGSGKTNFSIGMLLQFWKKFTIPFLAIEPTKTEYRSLIDEIPELQIFTPGKNNLSPFVINPFIPPKGVTVESYTPSLAAAFKASFSMPNPLPDIFLGAINDCYTEYGWKKNSTVDDPDVELFGLYEFIKVFKRNIEHLNYKGESKANIESAGLVRLVSMIEQNSNIYDTIHTIPIEDLVSHPTVLELNAINNKEQKSLIMALMLILFCVYTKNNVSGDGKLKNILLIDEAHVLLGHGKSTNSENADSQGSTIESLEDMIKEIRSYGTGIIIADQSPISVGKEIVANTDVKVMFKLVEKDNKDIVKAATNMSDLNYELLGRLGVGDALLHFGKLDNHLHIHTYNVHEKASVRDVILDNELDGKIHYWKSHQNLLMAHRECIHNCFCRGYCDQELRTDADFISSKLINEKLYKIQVKDEFIKYLVVMNKDIENIARKYSSIKFTKKLLNCTKIKFLRKAMIKKDFGITNEDYDRILSHPKFLLE